MLRVAPSLSRGERSRGGDWKSFIRSRLASLRLSPARESEIAEELAQHLDTLSHAPLRRRASAFAESSGETSPKRLRREGGRCARSRRGEIARRLLVQQREDPVRQALHRLARGRFVRRGPNLVTHLIGARVVGCLRLTLRAHRIVAR